MDFAELLTPTSKKFWIFVIAFLVIPNIVSGENTTCDPWYGAVMDLPYECTTETTTAIVPFFGLMSLMILLFDFSIFLEMFIPFIIQVVIAYVVACLVVEYFMKPGKK